MLYKVNCIYIYIYIYACILYTLYLHSIPPVLHTLHSVLSIACLPVRFRSLAVGPVLALRGEGQTGARVLLVAVEPNFVD